MTNAHEKRRVAFITNLCPHYCRPLFELLAKRLDVHFYFFSEGRENWVSRDLRLERGAFRTVEVARKQMFGEPYISGLLGQLRRSGYETVVKCLNGRIMVPYTYLLARTLDVPFVLWTGMWSHPTTPFHQVTRRLTNQIYKGSDAIVAYGEHVRRHLINAGVRDEKIFIAPQSVDATRFDEPEHMPPESPEVLYVGQFEVHKGIPDLLRAAELLKDEHMTLTFIGSGTLRPLIERYAMADRRVRVEDWMPPDDLPRRLLRATCLVLPSVTTAMGRETWGLVANEAMLAGLPVVATNAVGAAAGGLVRHRRNGIVIKERDTAALAAAIRSLISNRTWVRELGKNARLDVAGFSYEAMADGFIAAIEHAVSVRALRRGVLL